MPEISANVPKSLRLIISINDNGGFNRYCHVGKEERQEGGRQQKNNKLRRISRRTFESFLRYSFVTRTGA